MSQPEIATPSGIRHAFPLFHSPAPLRWDREALRGLAYVATDHGPLKRWLSEERRMASAAVGSSECGAPAAMPIGGGRRRGEVGSGGAGPGVVS